MKNISDRLSSLSPARRELLEQLLKRQKEQFNTFPVSPAQQSMWVLHQLSAETVSYNIVGGLECQGPLRTRVLQRVLSTIVGRHEALRTIFPTIDGQPVQAVQPPRAISLPLIDLSALVSREQAREQLCAQQASRPFHLASGPLLRALVIRLQADEHLLLVAAHHIVLDGWSMGVLINELTLLYTAFADNLPSPLPPLPLQYADVARWQRQWLASPARDEQLAYWTAQLQTPPLVVLPTDHPRPTVPTFAGAIESFSLAPELHRALLELGAQAEATLFMTLASAFLILLARLTAQTDLIFGTPIANRTRVELEGLIGCFINTLALRVDVADNPRVCDLLKRVKRITQEAYANQDLPFETLVEALQPERQAGQNPLFQTMFVLQNAPMPQIQLQDLRVRALSLPRQVAELDLTLNLWESEEGLHGHIEYSTELFERASIVRLIAHFQILLEAMVRWPQRPIGLLPLLSEEERAQLLAPRQIETRQESAVWLLHDSVEQQALSTPQRVAMVAGESALTYQAVLLAARRVAGHLQALGIGPEYRVGLCLARCTELVIGMLGILQAGGTVVPLDPAYPAERLHFMCEHARCVAVLTTREQQPLLAEVQASLLWIADLLAEPAAPPVRALPVVSPRQAAYLIYTSGSTGRPRGVILEHRSLASFIQVARRLYAVDSGDRVLQFASISFDISLEEIYVSLASGATLVLRDEVSIGSLPLFLAECVRQGITLLDLPTAYWHELAAFLDEQSVRLPAALRLVIIGGERALPERLARWCRPGGAGVQVINTYGPTETSVVATAWTPEQQVSPQAEVPIGLPLAHAEVLLLDRYGQLAPIGTVGEMYIGGGGLARGYQQAADLTAERFVPHAYSNRPGERLYRSGDLARRRADGVLDYLGRTDTQIKIRGYRIEAGEIEAVVSAHPAIRHCIVVAHEQGAGQRRLVAYLVVRQSVAPGEVRAYLRERLPEYMLPAQWIVLESLPLTPGGKIDRRALARMAGEYRESAREEGTPRTSREMQLMQIWARVLGREQVGIQENFFELGGHSLLALQVLGIIREEMQVQLAAGTLFAAPTIAELATVVAAEKSATFSCLVPLKAGSGPSPLFCLHPAGGEVWFYQALAGLLEKNQPVYGLQSLALQDGVAEQASIEQMVSTYAAAVRQQQPQGPYALCGWSLGGVLALALAAELERMGQRVSFVALLDSYLDPVEEQERDPLEAAGTAFAGSLFRAFRALGPREQAQVRNELLALPVPARLTRALAWGKEQGALPASISEAAFAAQVSLIEAHSRVLVGYRPACIQAPLLVCWAAQTEEKRTAWGLYSTGGVEEHVLAADHFTLLHPPHLQGIARQLTHHLQTAHPQGLPA